MSEINHPSPLTFTDAAAMRIQELLIEEGNFNLKLRVYITGGGCSGFQYGFAFDENTREDDCLIEKEMLLDEEEDDDGKAGGKGKNIQVGIVVDALSIMYLTGAQIDYVESLQGAHFTVKNPNAQTTCSCGSSFSL